MVLEEILKHDETFRYQLLNWMRTNCDYRLEHGNSELGGVWDVISDITKI